MRNRLKNLAVLLVMAGVAVWAVVTGLMGGAPGTLVLHVPGPGVDVWVGAEPRRADSKVVGPIELTPGDYPVRVARGDDLLFSGRLTVEPGRRKELWVRDRLASHGPAAAPDDGAVARFAAGVDAFVLPAGAGRSFRGHEMAINALAFTDDGRRAVSTARDGTLKVWDLETGRSERSLRAGYQGLLTGFRLLPGGRQGLSLADDVRLTLWDLDRGASVRQIPTGEGTRARCLDLSDDGRLVAIGAENGAVYVLDVDSGRRVGVHRLARATPGGLAFSPDGRTLLIGLIGEPGAANPVEVWDLDDDRVRRRLAGHDGPVLGVAYLPDGRRAASVGRDGTLRVWDVADGRELSRCDDHPGAAQCVAVSADGRLALVGTGHGWDDGWAPALAYGARLWDLDSGRLLARFETNDPVHAVALSPDGRRALAGGEDLDVHLWDVPAFHPNATAGNRAKPVPKPQVVAPKIVRADAPVPRTPAARPRV